MTDAEETREQRLGRLRAWARPPYRVLDVKAPEILVPRTQTASGVTKFWPHRPDPVDVLPGKPGGATTFNAFCDAPPGTTVSEGGGPFLNQPTVLCVFWGSVWTGALSPGVGDIYAAVTSLSDRVTNQYGSYSYFDGLGAGWGFDLLQPLIVTSSTVNIPTVFSNANVESAVRAFINSQGPYQSWDLIVLFMPPGYSTSGGLLGEHSFYWDQGDPSVNYAWIDYASDLPSIILVFSHELVESMTDPHGDGMQVDPRNATNWNEICDVCCSAGFYNGLEVWPYFVPAVGACMIPSPPGPALAPGDYLIDSVRKVREANGPMEYIQSVTGPGIGSGRWSLPEVDVVTLIKSGQASFYTQVDGVRADIFVERWYLKTIPDEFIPNNLDSLPLF